MGFKPLAFNTIENNLRAALGRPLPGNQAQFTLAPSGRKPINLEDFPLDEARKAAVMALLFPEGNTTRIVLTQRVEYPGVHSGQISFPGGKREDHDRDFLETALRETHEEVGITPEEINVAGGFSQLYIPPSNFLVQPYLGFLREPPRYEREIKEVHKILPMDFNAFLNESSVQTTTVSARGAKLRVPAFVIDEHIVWGATAMMLAELRAMALNG